MNNSTRYQIKFSQLSLLVIALIPIGKMLTLPSIIAADTGKDAWITAAAGAILESIILGMFYIVYTCNKDKTLYGLLKDTLGGFAAKLILMMFAVFFLWRVINMTAENYLFFNNIMLLKCSYIIFCVPLLLCLSYVAYKGLRVIARNMEILFIAIVAPLIIIILLSVTAFNFTNILPVDFSNSVSQAFKYSGWFGDTLVLFLMIGKIRPIKNSGAVTAVTATITVLLVTALFFVFVGIKGQTAQHNRYAISKISQYNLRLTSHGRVDRLLLCFWSFGLFMQGALMLYGAYDCVVQAFSLEKAKAKIAVLAALSVAVIAAPLFLQPYDNVVVNIYLMPAVQVLHYVVLYGLPFIITLVAVASRRKTKLFTETAYEKQ